MTDLHCIVINIPRLIEKSERVVGYFIAVLVVGYPKKIDKETFINDKSTIVPESIRYSLIWSEAKITVCKLPSNHIEKIMDQFTKTQLLLTVLFDPIKDNEYLVPKELIIPGDKTEERIIIQQDFSLNLPMQQTRGYFETITTITTIQISRLIIGRSKLTHLPINGILTGIDSYGNLRYSIYPETN
jgi:hypothetical protein